MASQDAVTLIWYTTRPATCHVFVTGDNGEYAEPATADGCRNRARIAGLTSGRSYPYRICAGRRALTGHLMLQTDRPAGQRFAFLVFGDSGRGTQAQYELAAAMVRVDPPADFLLHVGDLVYSNGQRHRFGERFFTPYRTLLARVCFWPCLGNHDLGESGVFEAYREVFELPQNGPVGLNNAAGSGATARNYWFDYASCRVAVFDSNQSEEVLDGQVAPWLREVMTQPGPRWRFAVCHHPPYTAGRYAPNETLLRTIVPVLDQTGVDIMFNGHDHNYQRTWPIRSGRTVGDGEGTVYIVSGAGGAELYPAKPQAARPDYVAFIDDQHHSFTEVTVEGDVLSLRQIGIGGKVIEKTVLHKRSGGPATVTATSASATPQSVGSATGP
jgi:hypothetical protein